MYFLTIIFILYQQPTSLTKEPMILKTIKFFEKQSYLSYIITLILAITIFYLSSRTFPPSTEYNPLKPYLYHFGIFLLLSFFLMVSLIKGKYSKFFMIVIILSLLYAILDELHQSLVPGRDASFGDVLIDSFGIVFSFIIYSISL